MNALKILYQDESLILLEKPCGLPSLPAKPGAVDPDTVQGRLQAKFPKAKLVHRLDNDTSGLMVAAANETIYKSLRALWNTDKVAKKYSAVVFGKPPLEGEINTPIAHHPRKNQKMVVDGEKARAAHTKFKTIRYFKSHSLIEVEITTGVRHQIRVHLASIGHPIIGDTLYQKEKSLGRRLFLHLSFLQFPHPITQKIVVWYSELPRQLIDEMQKLL